MTYILSADPILRMMTFSSQEPSRDYLAGVLIEPAKQGGVFIIATDGARMGAWYDETAIRPDDAKPIILSNAKPILAALKYNPRQWAFVSIDPAGTGRLTAYEAKAAIDVQALDNVRELASVPAALVNGTFPDWRRVWPKATKAAGENSSFEARYLGDFAKVADNPKNATIAIYPAGDKDSAGSPHVVRVGGRAEFCGLIMPKRASIGGPVLPAWLDLPKADAPAKAA